MDHFVISTDPNSAGDSFATWPFYFWILLASGIFGFVCILTFVFDLYYVSGTLIFYEYVIWVVLLFAFISLMSWIFSKGTHFHHYFSGLIIMSVCGHHNFIVSAFHGLANGMYVEGCARWSMD